MDVSEFILDLYEIELNKRSMYSDSIMGNKAKEGKELEFAIAIQNIKIIEKILDLLGNE